MNELEQILGDVNHLKVHLEFGIFVLEGVVAMRRGNEDLLHSIVDKSLDVFLGQALEQLLIPRLADALSAAAFLGTQDSEIHPGLVEDGRRGPGHFLQSRVIAEVAAGEIQDLHVLR